MTQNTEQNVRTRDEHRDERCIEHLAGLMRDKMRFSREVKGRAGWQDMPADVLSRMLRDHVDKGDPVDVANFCMMLAAKRAPIAEARGAEEQRRKDAEGAKVSGWVHPDQLKVLHTPNGARDGERFCVMSLVRVGSRDIPLYTRPANVTALEALVASLKEAEQLARADAEASKAGRCKDQEVIRWLADRLAIADPDLKADCDLLSRAALTREGGV